MRRLLALLVLALSTLALATPAHAGGPTSVLITDPESGNAAALYYSEPAYAELDTLVVAARPLDGEPSDLGTRSLNLTWMIHDVSPWRTQQLYPDAADGPVITDGATWSRVTRGNVLLAMIDELMIPNGIDAVTAPEPAPDPVVEERVVTETAWWSLTGWRWAVLGLLVGAGTVLLVARRSAPRETPLHLEPGAEVLTR